MHTRTHRQDQAYRPTVDDTPKRYMHALPPFEMLLRRIWEFLTAWNTIGLEPAVPMSLSSYEGFGKWAGE